MPTTELDSDNKKENISLSTLVDACKKCCDYVEKLSFIGKEHDKLASQNKDLVVLLDREKELNASNKYRESCFKNKVANLEKVNKETNRLPCEKIEDYKFQLKILVERDETIVKMQLEIIEKQKVITKLRKKLDQCRSTKYMCTQMFGAQRDTQDSSGLGHQDVSPPFNGNYSFLPNEEDLTSVVYGTRPLDY